eukprot:SM000173S03005  [mRNA]  locus=s173:159440:161354:+ [translate_table: standard]
MGTTLAPEDLKAAAAMRREIVAGVVLQYTVMPAIGALVASSFSLPRPFALGIILVACCPGGTASNIVTFLARGNVALSVLMTASSTTLAVVMTPLLTKQLAGHLVPVEGRALFLSTLQVVLLPVVLGSALGRFLPRTTSAVAPVAPLAAVLVVALVCGSAVASNRAAILASGKAVAGAVALLHLGGFLGGYIASSLLGFSPYTSRTISIEVGMQNSVLGVVLAAQHFADSPLVAVPCAISSVTHSVMGSLLAAYWRAQKPPLPGQQSSEYSDPRLSQSSLEA